MTMDPIVYVVDDDDMVRNTIIEAIQSIGPPVVASCSANEFFEKYEPETAGCVVTDVRMPGMSGTELCASLKHRRMFLLSNT